MTSKTEPKENAFNLSPESQGSDHVPRPCISDNTWILVGAYFPCSYPPQNLPPFFRIRVSSEETAKSLCSSEDRRARLPPSRAAPEPVGPFLRCMARSSSVAPRTFWTSFRNRSWPRPAQDSTETSRAQSCLRHVVSSRNCRGARKDGRDSYLGSVRNL